MFTTSNTGASSSTVASDEDAVDFYLKLNLIKMYRECLMERARFKKIAREYGLINNATALINNHNKVLNNHASYYNSSLAYFNNKTANSYYNSFNFIINKQLNGGAPNVASSAAAGSVNGGGSHGNGLMGLSNGSDEASNGANTFNINYLLANGDLIDGKKKGKRSENDKEMM